MAGKPGPAPDSANARLARMKRRTQAAIVREQLAIRRFAAGMRVDEIANEMRAEFGGTFSPDTTRAIIRRGLARLAQNTEDADQARALITEGYRQILAAHMPYATGALGDGPSVRSAEIAMKALDKIGEVSGVRRVPDLNQGGVSVQVNINEPGGIDAARNQILDGLRREAEKLRLVDGALASVGTSQRELTSGEPEDDSMGPPPGVIPTQEEAA